MASMVQYIVVRSDLTKTLKWPLGALVAQACHACSAVMFLFRDDPNVKEYTSNLDSMHKVVLEALDQESLTILAAKLTENNVDHKLWIEQPENIPTCLVTKPYNKEDIRHYFKAFKLLK